ncbi:MAG TPA: hypothetical protein VMR23_11710, partial [Candidatus Limnocylindria bacterium]|nr:hypothetical protein [Candidatus Limnocylindria bacterium]
MRHRRALAVVIAAVLVTAAAVTVTWQWLGDERRLGAVAGRLLALRTGLPVTVGAAHGDGGHLTLLDIRLGSPPFDVRVARLDVTGGLLSLLASAESSIDIAATSVSVTIAEGGRVPPVDALRARLLSLLDAPGTMRLTMLGGELQRGGRTFVFDLTGAKGRDGVDMTLSVGPPAQRWALTMGGRATVGRAGAVQLAVALAGEPRRLEGLWPATLPPPTALTSRADVVLVKGGDAHASGRVTLGAS